MSIQLDPAQFWENIEIEVNEQKTTFRWLASRIEVPETTVSGWRRNNVFPRADHVYLIAQSLGKTVEYLFSRKKESFIYDLQIKRRPRLKVVIDNLFLIPDESLDHIDALTRSFVESLPRQENKTAE